MGARHSVRPVLGLVLVVAGVAMLGCRKTRPNFLESSSQEQLPPVAALAPAERARLEYRSQCGACHGERGDGDGPGAQALDPKPRSLRDRSWQLSATDEKIRSVIWGGGQAVGLSAAMPAYARLRSDPAVTTGLVQLIREFAGRS